MITKNKYKILIGFVLSALMFVMNFGYAMAACNWSHSGSYLCHGGPNIGARIPSPSDCPGGHASNIYSSSNPDCQALGNYSGEWCDNHGRPPEIGDDDDDDDDGGGGGGSDPPSCQRGDIKTNTGQNSCTYWDNVDWEPVDLSTGTQTSIQVLRTNTCTWSCSYDSCDSPCSSSCNPGCPPDDPTIRPAAVCGDGEMNSVLEPNPNTGLCPGITPQYPVNNPPVDDLAYTRTRAYVTNDPRDPEGRLTPVDQLQCDNPMGMEYLEMVCEECDDGFCGSDTCYGPRDGAAYACRFRPANCEDGIFQPNGANAELCDPSVHPHCSDDCQSWAECGDGKENWPPNFTEPEECDDGKQCSDGTECTDNPSICALGSQDCQQRDGDECDSNCQIENQGGVEETL